MLSLAIFSSEGGFFLSFGRDAHLAQRTPREGGKVFWELDLKSCACGVRDARLDGAWWSRVSSKHRFFDL